ncbi:MAG: carbohydrate kinase family protein, partial [Terriglobales bacterium]
MAATKGPAVLGIGNACLDTVITVPRLPRPGDHVPGLERHQFAGGQGAGAMAGCARLGLQARFMLRSGDDPAAAAIWAALLAAGVDLRLWRRCAALPTPSALILRERTGERMVFWSNDPRLEVEADAITEAIFEGVAALYLDGRDGPASLRAAALARARGLPVVADLDWVYPHTPALIDMIDHVIVPASFPALQPRTGQTVVVTRGESGAEAEVAGQPRMQVPGFAVTAVDSTGAGDAFHAAYIYALLQGCPLRPRLEFANAAGALACTRLGAHEALPDCAAINQL